MDDKAQVIYPALSERKTERSSVGLLFGLYALLDSILSPNRTAYVQEKERRNEKRENTSD